MLLSVIRKSSAPQAELHDDDASSALPERKTSSKFSETCVVCGDQATGYHYEVSSCNGCKTFFRRTIVAHRIYKCHKNGNCIFNKDIRCACRACRFAKCLAVGMNPKAIQCNRTGSRILSPSNPPSPPQDPTVATTLSALLPQTTVISTGSSTSSATTSIDDKTHIQKLKAASPSSSSSPNSERSVYKRPYTVSALLDLPQFSPSPSIKEEATRKLSQPVFAYSTKESTDPCDEIPYKRNKSDASEKMISRLLTLQENVSTLRNSNYMASDSILDLLTRPCAMDCVNDYMTPKTEDKELDFGDRLNRDIAFAVEYAKSFDVFRRMPLEDKCFLLRDVTLVLSLFENAYQAFLSNSSKTSSAYETAFIKTEAESSSARMSTEESPLQLATECLVRAELDRSEYVLLKAIVFLHAECFGLSSKTYKQLVDNRQLVLDALFDYMMSTYGKSGPVKYGNVLSVSWTLFKTAQRYKEMIEKLHPLSLSEEIFSNKLPTRLV